MTPPPTRRPTRKQPSDNRCLSCGTTQNMRKKRYCSVDCRQKLRQKLNMHTGLLKALSTRYATFHFSSQELFLEILTHGSNTRFRFVGRRYTGKKPAEDFQKMAGRLGAIWWAEKRRTNRWYLASKHLLNKAGKSYHAGDAVKPMIFKKPARVQDAIGCLKLSASEMNSPRFKQKIKTAYRMQAKKHHPDSGGDAMVFRKIHAAYQEMARWAEKPTFARRRGFPDRWFYNSRTNRWVQPTPSRDWRPAG